MTDEQWNALFITLFVLLLLLFFFGLAMYWPSNEVVVQPDVPSVLIVDGRKFLTGAPATVASDENLYNVTPTSEGRSDAVNTEWPQPGTPVGRRGRDHNTQRDPPVLPMGRASSLNALRAPRENQVISGSAPTMYRLFDNTPTPQALPETSASPFGSQSAQETQRQESASLDSFLPVDRGETSVGFRAQPSQIPPVPISWKRTAFEGETKLRTPRFTALAPQTTQAKQRTVWGYNFYRPTASYTLHFAETQKPYLAAEGYVGDIPNMTTAQANEELYKGKRFVV